MSSKNTLFGIILLQAIFYCSLAQNNEIRFKLVEGINGEPLGKITCMTQDPHGYMWFASQGERCLYRYDGTRLTTFRHDNLDANSLGGVDVFKVYADNNGLIWVGFSGEGLDQYNPVTGIFKHYRHSDNDPGSLADNGVGSILQDHQGRLWLGTGGGLDLLDEKSGKFIHHRHDPKNPRTLSSNIVWNIYEDRQGVLWIATGFPWFHIDPDDGGLNRLEPDGSFTRFMHDPKNPHSLINNKVRAIFEDSRGVFWVGTSGDGLHTLDRKTGRFERHLYDPKRPEKLSRPRRLTDDWHNYNDQVTFITEDRLGGIWIGAMHTGINRYDTVSKTITHYESSNGFPDQSGWNSFVSRDSVLWITTEESNLYRVELNRKTINDIVLHTSAHRFLEEKDGTLWVAAQNGLLQLDKNKKVLHRFLLDPENPEAPVNNATSLFQNQKDTLWIGAHKGFGIFDKRTQTFSRVSLDAHSRDEDLGIVIQIMQDHEGLMWFTTTQNGLMCYNPKDASVKWYRADEKNPEAISSNSIITVQEDKSGIIWVGTGGALDRFDKKTGTFSHYLTTTKTTFLFNDPDGTLWSGTSSGLYQYNEKDNRFSGFGIGSVIHNDRIFGMVEDDARNLWVATPSAITKINAERNETFTYGNKVGISDLAPGAIYKTSKGEILVGHGNGFYSFFPEKFGLDKQPTSIMITDILINNLPLTRKEEPGKLQPKAVEEVSELTLKHDENNLIFKYASDDYRATEATKYFTLLENYDNVWREAAADRATYFYNLPPGNYVYRIKAYNAFGSKVEKAIAIQIAPPWWKTWWAYSFYGFCGVTLLYLSRREIVRRERLRSAFKLEHLELEKAKEVDRVKSTFFTNISHEFRTPLALIKGPVQDLMEKYAGDSKTQEKLELVQRNSDLLLKLINQLLNLARLESGGQKIEATEFNLNSFVGAIAGSFSSMARHKNVILNIDPPSLNCSVLFDKDKLETIFINLINNAIKFTPSGGEVSVKAKLIDKDSGSDIISVSDAVKPQLVISVQDNGIGIPIDQQAKIFERFYQLSEDHKEVGTGIGLSLVKELTILLNGVVDVKSTPGVGSEFKVILPIDLVRVSKELVADIAFTSIENGIHPGDSGTTIDMEPMDKPHILVVEDNFDMRKFIMEALGDSYRILEAEDGKEGLETAIREIPELIVSDVMMPQMDGIAMTGRLKKDFRTCHIPVILLTAKVTEESKLIGLDKGADDYIAKPFNKHELLLKVRNNIVAREKIHEKIRMELLREVPKLEVQSADEKFLVKVKETIQNRLSDEQLGVESLAEDIGLSRAQLYRKTIALTGISVNEMIRSFRLQKAAQLLEQDWGTVSQITYEVGFSSPSYFSKCFKDQFGMIPSEYSARKSG